MLWLDKHQRALRLVILALALIVLTGPWGFDLINVPAQYSCTRPNFRLEGDFCGMPISGMSAFATVIRSMTGTLVRTMAGETLQTKLALDLWGFFIILTPLPVFCTFLLLLLGERLGLQVFHVVLWGLAIAGSVWFLLFWNSVMLGLPPIQLWGYWIYILLALAVILLETIVIVGRGRLTA